MEIDTIVRVNTKPYPDKEHTTIVEKFRTRVHNSLSFFLLKLIVFDKVFIIG
jgi:hypothetical protein